MKTYLFALLLVATCGTASPAAAATAEIKDLSINGGLENGKARLVIEADMSGLPRGQEKLIYATTIHQSIQVAQDKIDTTFNATFDILQGDPKELILQLSGGGGLNSEIRSVTGPALQDWSIRRETNAPRSLVLRFRTNDAPAKQLLVEIKAERELRSWISTDTALILTPQHPSLFNGYVTVASAPEIDVDAENSSGLIPVESRFLPGTMRVTALPGQSEPLAFRFLGSAYTLPLKLSIADPEARRVVLHNFNLVGQLSDQLAAFTLTATARVKNPEGGSIVLLSGNVGLLDADPSPAGRLRFDGAGYRLSFEQAGEYPIRLRFNATIRPSEGSWNNLDFHVAPSTLQPVTLQRLVEETQFRFTGAANPQRSGSNFVSALPATGQVSLAWKEAKPDTEGKLFFAAESLAQISISPGLMRQVGLLDFKVMQGEMTRVDLRLRGPGEITQVQGAQVLSWNVRPIDGSSDRQLTVQLNQPQKDQFSLQVQAQTSLGAFPQNADALEIQPEGATRSSGFIQLINDGAVRLEVAESTGLTQISPEQFPENNVTRALFRPAGGQKFAFRFSGSDFALRVQAGQVLPDVTVSEVLAYRVGESELSIEAEIELDIREAPLREALLRVPKGYAVAHLVASGLSDYFLTEPANQSDADLRLVYGQPLTGRQLIQLRLERNTALGTNTWALPRIELVQAKSVRGYVGAAADAGFRLTPELTDKLSEVATAFFPKKIAGIQAAYRISEAAWQARLRVDRLPQSIQADALHLFSIGEGIAYGSSVVSYNISGAPVSSFQVELSPEYFNVEFSGKEVRNWQKTERGFTVQLHSPVSGAYTLLATYERPFRNQGETLPFTGARPLDVQSEQGYTLVISAYQFQVRPVNVSPALMPLETGEVPPEYRLFFDAPILAAYRYTSRPFNLSLELSPLAQGDSLSQVVDRASYVTHISKEGQVLTDARFLLKSRGNSNFRLTLPPGTELWSATVNGATVVPVIDANTNLIPLPARGAPNALLTVDLKLASRSPSPTRVTLRAPIVGAPVMLADWSLRADARQRLNYLRGSLTPIGGTPDVSGFAQLAATFAGGGAQRAALPVAAMLVLLGISIAVWKWASGPGIHRYSARHWSGLIVGFASFVFALVWLFDLGQQARLPVLLQHRASPGEMLFLAPVQQTGSALSVEIANVEDKFSILSGIGYSWPLLLALLAWFYAWSVDSGPGMTTAKVFGWMAAAWVTLRLPNGAPAFLILVGVFLNVCLLVPGLRRLAQLPVKPAKPAPTPTPTPPTALGPAPGTVALLLLGLFWPGFSPTASADVSIPSLGSAPVSGAPFGVSPNGVRSGEFGETPNSAGGTPALLLATTLSTARAPRTYFVAAVTPGAITTPTNRVRTLPKDPPMAESVRHRVRVKDEFVLGTATVRWQAIQGQLLPILFEPAVMTRIQYPTNALHLVIAPIATKQTHQLMALQSGTFEVELEYQLPTSKFNTETGFLLPTQFGLVNSVEITIPDRDVEVYSNYAVSVEPRAAEAGTAATIVLSAVNNPYIGWKPKSRDLKREKPAFYAQLSQLYVPSAGIIEGVHQVSIRPSQGELAELIFNVPERVSITDVADSVPEARAATPSQVAAAAAVRSSVVSLWRFDPDNRKLRVSLNPAQSRPFALVIRSQMATAPLPFEQTVGLLSVENAENQIGSLAIATGNDVQLGNVTANGLTPINIEDFTGGVVSLVQARGVTVRRAFRYSDPAATASLQAAQVEPDIRVQTQQTLSLAEDRVVLAATPTVTIARAGIFRLSFVMPAGFDVESISGAALSHWSESTTGAGRVITLNLRDRTEGEQKFAINLAGPGVRSTNGWQVPRLILREASKERGKLIIVPEQGMRLQAGTRDGVTQEDPVAAGIRQRGVMLFDILQLPWNLALDIEQLDSWVQVTSLQHATVNEAQLKVAANLQYQIENTGVRSLRVQLPIGAEGVLFRGDQISDFRLVAGAATNGLQPWEIKFERRVIGAYTLQVTYQSAMPQQAAATTLQGIQAVGVNLQRGFVTVQSGGRLQLRIASVPAALQPTEWQSIPRTLQQGLPATAAALAYRLVEPGFALPLQIERHEAAKLLPARVNQITLNSVISDDGVMLTQVRLDLMPGDKRLLQLTLPANAKFWFAFVNQNGVWPWREQERTLIPLEPAPAGKTIPVEIYYSSQVGAAVGKELKLGAPKFDLPLENITWQVFLNEKWKLRHWEGSLQLEREGLLSGGGSAPDLSTYFSNEQSLQRSQTSAAEQRLNAANASLQQGDPQQARREFQAAFNLSANDAAFNEDARVQLHNLKLQQALIGLNVQRTAGGDQPVLRDLRNRGDANYTQKDAQQIIDRNSADENSALLRLAERIVQQQDAAVSTPGAIRATIPEQGRVLTFKRSVAVDSWADLNLQLDTQAVKTASWAVRVIILAVTMLLLGLIGLAGRSFFGGVGTAPSPSASSARR